MRTHVEYLIKFGALTVLNGTLERVWHDEKSNALELVVFTVQLPEGHDRELLWAVLGGIGMMKAFVLRDICVVRGRDADKSIRHLEQVRILVDIFLIYGGTTVNGLTPGVTQRVTPLKICKLLLLGRVLLGKSLTTIIWIVIFVIVIFISLIFITFTFTLVIILVFGTRRRQVVSLEISLVWRGLAISRQLSLIIIKLSQIALYCWGIIVHDSIEYTHDHLNRDHLVLLLWVGNALVVLATLESKLLVIPIFLLLYQALHKILPAHLLSVIKVWLGFVTLACHFGPLTQAGVEWTVRFRAAPKVEALYTRASRCQIALAHHAHHRLVDSAFAHLWFVRTKLRALSNQRLSDLLLFVSTILRPRRVDQQLWGLVLWSICDLVAEHIVLCEVQLDSASMRVHVPFRIFIFRVISFILSI